MNLVLYHNDISTCAQKVRLVLAEKGLPYEAHDLDLRAGDQKKPEYLKLNPAGIVPTLVHDGEVLTESSVIIQYLDDAFSETPLSPEGAVDRARMRLWMKRIDDRIHGMVGVLSFVMAFRHEYLSLPDKGQRMIEAQTDPMMKALRAGMLAQGPDFPATRVALEAMLGVFDDLDAALTGGYLCGLYSLADASWTPYIHRLEVLGLDDLWKEHGRLSAWWASITDRPSYAQAIAEVEKPHRIALCREKAEEARPRIDEWLEAIRTEATG